MNLGLSFEFRVSLTLNLYDEMAIIMLCELKVYPACELGGKSDE
jgi:hypothetical protein